MGDGESGGIRHRGDIKGPNQGTRDWAKGAHSKHTGMGMGGTPEVQPSLVP